MKEIQISVTTTYSLKIDENNHVVKEYESESELIEDLASYAFSSVLPVIEGGGVQITDRNVETWEYV